MYAYATLLSLAPLAALFMPGHDVPPLCLPTRLAPRDHQRGMYVKGVPSEVIRLHTRTTYTPARFRPLADHRKGSPLVRRVDVPRDRLLVVSKLYPASSPPAPYLWGILRGRGRELRAEPPPPSRFSCEVSWRCWPRLRGHEYNARVGRNMGGSR